MYMCGCWCVFSNYILIVLQQIQSVSNNITLSLLQVSWFKFCMLPTVHSGLTQISGINSAVSSGQGTFSMLSNFTHFVQSSTVIMPPNRLIAHCVSALQTDVTSNTRALKSNEIFFPPAQSPFFPPLYVSTARKCCGAGFHSMSTKPHPMGLGRPRFSVDV